MTLELTRQDLCHVPVADMTKLILSLRKLSCNYCNMTSEMTMMMVKTVGRTGSKMRSLGMIRSDLTSVPTLDLERAVKKLDQFAINYCRLTEKQKAILNKI